MAYTVIFEGSPRQVKGNPMTLESGFGKVLACGYGHAFAQNDILEEALNTIADGNMPHQADQIAAKALDEAEALMMKD